MALTLSAANETEFKPIPTGSHHATCIRIIDLGTQKVEFQNEIKMQAKILIQWEVNANGDTELMTDDGKPFLISKRYTASLHSKSQLSADLKSWRGRDFTEEERAAFDLKNILGKTCLISIAHEPSKDGQRTYANIAAISNKMRGYEPPPTINEVFAFDLDDPDWDVFEKLSEKLKEQIYQTPEWAELKAQGATPNATTADVPPPPKQQHSGAVKPTDELASDIPF